MKLVVAALAGILLLPQEEKSRITVVPPAEVPWKANPQISKDAESVVQYGDPASGEHILRLKFPAGMFRPPHYHTYDECVTVLSGTILFGRGSKVDESKEVAVEAGGYMVIPGGAPHWIRTKTEVSVLVYANGPRDTVLLDAPPQNVLTEEEKQAGWRLLFDGKTTKGWRGYRKDRVPDGWKVIAGALVRVKGGPGGKGAGGGDDIITLEQFENFELVLEWRIVPGGNSGVLFRVSEDAVTSWHSAPEMQVLDNTKYPTRSVLQLAGACYDLYAAKKAEVKTGDEWNRARLLVDGAHVEHWLNGEKIAEYEIGSDEWNQKVAGSKFKQFPRFAKEKKGYICLQDHSQRVEYRNLKIRVLPAR